MIASARPPKLRVLIADDQGIVRAGLRLLIEGQLDMEVVGEAANSSDAIRRATELSPDVIVIETGMSDGGVTAVETLEATCPDVKVLVLSMHGDPIHLRSCLAAGAVGYVLKRSTDADLFAAIRAVAQGRTFVDVGLTHVLVQEMASRRAPEGAGRPSLGSLSAREREVLPLLARGFTNQEVASRIQVSVKTVETYRTRLNKKLGLRSRAELVRFAFMAGLVRPEDLANEK